MSHVMVDLETMGTHFNAPITSIGAALIDNDVITSTFYAKVSLADAVKTGAVINPDTVLWWMRQSDKAREEISEGVVGTLSSVLDKFDRWILETCSDLEGVWGNGAVFDNAILIETYHRLNRPIPWPFWKNMCYRTLKTMYPKITLDRVGEHHHARDDAESQALHLIKLFKAIKASQT